MKDGPRQAQVELPWQEEKVRAKQQDLAATVLVAVDVAVDNLFSYSLNQQDKKNIKVGQAVSVPFRNRAKWGIVVEVDSQNNYSRKIKPILEILDLEPLFSKKQLQFLQWAAAKTFTPFNEVLKASIPSSLRTPGQWLYLLNKPLEHLPQKFSFKEKLIKKIGKKKYLKEKDFTNLEISKHSIKQLLSSGWFSLDYLGANEKKRKRTGKGKTIFADSEIRAEAAPVLIEEQKTALASITGAIDKKSKEKFLLFGITGSGKTEIYMQAIEKTLSLGRNALTLVPEIALTPQLINRYRARFGESLAVFHSALTEKQRVEQWQAIRLGKCRIVVGVRSAVLTPFSNLGLVIVDEEHEPSYKQEDRFLYHARDLAEKKALLENGVLLLGSATPALETYFRANKKDYQLLTLNTRPTGQLLPTVNIVDMKKEEPFFGQKLIISKVLREAISERIKNREQVILFLNRRGYFSFLLCPACGQGQKCPNCAVSLTVHNQGKEVRCHHCDFKEPFPEKCFYCAAEKIVPIGFGTQQLEEEVSRFFPEARILRIDRDTTQSRQAFDQMIDKLEKKKIDILIGTQMVAKGLDIPSVTLVGVLLADQSLHFPDFRSSERTFQLLTQVAGRSGRGEKRGEVFIQTYCPEHQSIFLAASQDYLAFYRFEIANRQEHGFPPFQQLVMMRFSATSEKRIKMAMQELKELIRQQLAGDKETFAYGPAAAAINKIAGRYRFQLLLKNNSIEKLSALCYRINPLVKELANKHDLRYKLDINPYQFM